MRKIIQIQLSDNMATLTALCHDGTVWLWQPTKFPRDPHDPGEWIRFSDVPQERVN